MKRALPLALLLVLLGSLALACYGASTTENATVADRGDSASSRPTECVLYDERCQRDALDQVNADALEVLLEQRERELNEEAALRESAESHTDTPDHYRELPPGGPPWWANVPQEPLDMSGYQQRSRELDALLGDS